VFLKSTYRAVTVCYKYPGRSALVFGLAHFVNITIFYPVVLQDYEHIKEAMIHKDWVDRIYFSEFLAKRSFGKTLGK